MNKLLFTNIHWITLFSSIIIILISIIVYFSIQKIDKNIVKSISNVDKLSKQINELREEVILNRNQLINGTHHINTNLMNSTNYIKKLINPDPAEKVEEKVEVVEENGAETETIENVDEDEMEEEGSDDNSSGEVSTNDEAISLDGTIEHDENTLNVVYYNNLNNKSKAELVELCANKNLPKTGNKDVLAKRLIDNGYTDN